MVKENKRNRIVTVTSDAEEEKLMKAIELMRTNPLFSSMSLSSFMRYAGIQLAEKIIQANSIVQLQNQDGRQMAKELFEKCNNKL
ncbi:MAG TPA: hypothetical protein P5277_01270 [Candidatus Paceibacterota bacterium]|nr:hypothetical protein [Candidatus Paceibacterota bacterium]